MRVYLQTGNLGLFIVQMGWIESSYLLLMVQVIQVVSLKGVLSCDTFLMKIVFRGQMCLNII